VGEIYDRQLTDIFSIQTDVALHIAAALKAELSPDEQTRVCREPTKDLEAYRLFLKVRLWFAKFTPSALERSIELFERAIKRDPDFALAYAYIAMAYTELVETGVVAPEPAYARAAASAQSALRIDPELAAAHCTIGFLKTVREFDWSGAERAFQRALELSPSDADTTVCTDGCARRSPATTKRSPLGCARMSWIR
jgi:serine/threonine-protein kinase